MRRAERREMLHGSAEKSAKRLGLQRASLHNALYVAAVELEVPSIARELKYLAPGKTPKGTKTIDQKKVVESKRQNANDPKLTEQVWELKEAVLKRELVRRYGANNFNRVREEVLSANPRLAEDSILLLNVLSIRLKEGKI